MKICHSEEGADLRGNPLVITTGCKSKGIAAPFNGILV